MGSNIFIILRRRIFEDAKDLNYCFETSWSREIPWGLITLSNNIWCERDCWDAMFLDTKFCVILPSPSPVPTRWPSFVRVRFLYIPRSIPQKRSVRTQEWQHTLPWTISDQRPSQPSLGLENWEHGKIEKGLHFGKSPIQYTILKRGWLTKVMGMVIFIFKTPCPGSGCITVLVS